MKVRVSFLVAAIFAGWSASASAENLQGDEITALFSDARATGYASNGKGYMATYDADGSVDFRFNDGSFRDSGTWSVDGDLYCAEWRVIRNGDRGCWKVIHQGGNEYLLEGVDGVEDNEVEIEKR